MEVRFSDMGFPRFGPDGVKNFGPPGDRGAGGTFDVRVRVFALVDPVPPEPREKGTLKTPRAPSARRDEQNMSRV